MKQLSEAETIQFLDDLDAALKSEKTFVEWYISTRWASQKLEYDDTLSKNEISDLKLILRKYPTKSRFNDWHTRRVNRFEGAETLSKSFTDAITEILNESKSFSEIDEAYSELFHDEENDSSEGQWTGHPNLEPLFKIQLLIASQSKSKVEKLADLLLSLSTSKIKYPKHLDKRYKPLFVIHELFTIIISGHKDLATLPKNLVLNYYRFFTESGFSEGAEPSSGAVDLIFEFIKATRAAPKDQKEMFEILTKHHSLVEGKHVELKIFLSKNLGKLFSEYIKDNETSRTVQEEQIAFLDPQLVRQDEFDLCFDTKFRKIYSRENPNGVKVNNQSFDILESFFNRDALINGLTIANISNLISKDRTHSSTNPFTVHKAMERVRKVANVEALFLTETRNGTSIYRFNPKMKLLVGPGLKFAKPSNDDEIDNDTDEDDIGDDDSD